MFKGIDLSSDTATRPTLAMKQAMLEADVGDEQKNEDPTTRKLEEMLADMMGFSAALFFPSATMANEAAICCLSEPGTELLAAENAHLFIAETGGPAVHAHLMCKPIRTETGKFNTVDIKTHLHWSKRINHPLPSMISVENTTNFGGGLAWEKDELNEVTAYANKLELKKHMDGARIFNASIKTGLSVKTIASGFDMVTVCLSKGLGCPVGALLVFDKSYYQKIRRIKQLMGGSMRQSGILAAAGIYALQHNITRLQEDHDNAAFLARSLKDAIPQIHVSYHESSTNMVFFDWLSDKMTPMMFSQRCIEKGLRFSQVGAKRFRAVTHLGVTKEDIETAVNTVSAICLAECQ